MHMVACTFPNKRNKIQKVDMKKERTFWLVALVAMLTFATSAKAQMSDEAVISYVESGLSSGKSQNDILKELVAKGVTKEQLL